MSGLSISNWFLCTITPKDRVDIKTLKVVDNALSFWSDTLKLYNIEPILIKKHFWFDVYEYSEELEKFCLKHNVGIY